MNTLVKKQFLKILSEEANSGGSITLEKVNIFKYIVSKK
jgi:hypothetical protein